MEMSRETSAGFKEYSKLKLKDNNNSRIKLRRRKLNKIYKFRKISLWIDLESISEKDAKFSDLY